MVNFAFLDSASGVHQDAGAMVTGKSTSITRKTFPRVIQLCNLLLLLFGSITNSFASDGGEVLRPQAGEILDAGTYYRVTWSSPSEAEELELLLFFDGSPARKVRLTEQLDPDHQSYLWLVPDLPVRTAHIELRWGINGVEIPGPPGASFEIRSSSHRAALNLRWFDGEWWLTPRSGETELPPPIGRLCRESGTRLPVPALVLASSQDWFVPADDVSFDSSGCRGEMRASLREYWPSSRFLQAIPMRC